MLGLLSGSGTVLGGAEPGQEGPYGLAGVAPPLARGAWDMHCRGLFLVAGLGLS